MEIKDMEIEECPPPSEEDFILVKASNEGDIELDEHIIGVSTQREKEQEYLYHNGVYEAGEETHGDE